MRTGFDDRAIPDAELVVQGSQTVDRAFHVVSRCIFPVEPQPQVRLVPHGAQHLRERESGVGLVEDAEVIGAADEDDICLYARQHRACFGQGGEAVEFDVPIPSAPVPWSAV
jgi:hypothetical protein